MRIKEKRIQEENQARRKLDKIHKKKIAEAEKERSDRFENARKLIEKRLKDEEKIRLKEEARKKSEELEERKIRAEKAREKQLEEVKVTEEIKSENLRKLEDDKVDIPQEEKKTDWN